MFLISLTGLFGVWGIVFAESGLFFGFFLPGDSLLFTAGLLASQGLINPAGLYIGTIVAAILGDNVGYLFGKRVGPAIFTREESIFFSKKNVVRAQEFYDQYGVKTIILARFIPIVRTFAPIIAGVAKMNYRTFFLYNCIGGAGWVVLMVSAGFILGRVVPDIDRYVLPIILLIIVISFLPGVYHFWKARRSKTETTKVE
jgi:membrane-associated protein